MYAVFPFRLFSFEQHNTAWAVNALEHRWDRGGFGWRQDDLFMAYLGLTDQAREFLVNRATFVEGKVENGRIKVVKGTPAERENDLVVVNW